MTGARIDDYEGAAGRIDFDTVRRHDPREGIVHGPLELPAIRHQLYMIMEYMRDSLLQVLAILITALAHHIPKQDAPLSRVDHVLDARGQRRGRRCDAVLRLPTVIR